LKLSRLRNEERKGEGRKKWWGVKKRMDEREQGWTVTGLLRSVKIW